MSRLSSVTEANLEGGNQAVTSSSKKTPATIKGSPALNLVTASTWRTDILDHALNIYRWWRCETTHGDGHDEIEHHADGPDPFRADPEQQLIGSGRRIDKTEPDDISRREPDPQKHA